MLYGSDEEFTNAVDNYATSVCEELLLVLKTMGEEKQQQKQFNLTLELFWRVVTRADLHTSSMASLTAKLWALSHKLQPSNSKLRVKYIEHISNSESLVSPSCNSFRGMIDIQNNNAIDVYQTLKYF